MRSPPIELVDQLEEFVGVTSQGRVTSEVPAAFRMAGSGLMALASGVATVTVESFELQFIQFGS
jgi:hypothetical protein